ncbi:MAG: molybdopterin molybdotransferase MoeA [Bacteroidales bacterium]|nr:molybdopterin molybdotransferase MoeA [Bacteroidales bacterium]
MIPFDEAYNIVITSSATYGYEEVRFTESVNRVLASDLFSDLPMPPFDKSAMDGYACRAADIHQALQVIESVPAGVIPEKKISRGTCSQIMTGAMIPEGADTVIPVEDTERQADGTIRFTGKTVHSNICPLGEDVQTGSQVLSAGTLLRDRHIPILATIGAVQVQVYKKPSVAVLATGTELVEPELKPGRAQIRNSNAYQMVAQLNTIGIQADYMGIVPDDEERSYRQFRDALDDHDIMLLSGGVSMGRYDYVPKVLERLGFDLHFRKVAIQPGRPTTFASRDQKFVFGLPGNPVSSFMTLKLFVKPFIYRCMAAKIEPRELILAAGTRITRKKNNRLAWIPVKITGEQKVIPVDYHGSAHIFALSYADGMLGIPVGQSVIKEGEPVHVRPF